MAQVNAFIEDAVGDPVIVKHRASKIKTGVVLHLEDQRSQPATCADDVRWIKVQFDDGEAGLFYHTSVMIDLDWVNKIKEYED